MMSEQTGGPQNETARVEAFSDGVFAIAITLLILEIKVPHEQNAVALQSQCPQLSDRAVLCAAAEFVGATSQDP